MDGKMKKSHVQNLKFLAIIGILIITSFLSQTTKSSNTNSKFNPIIHLILNILIIAVGADAGLLSFFLHSPNHPPTTTQNPNNSLANNEHHDQDGDRDDRIVDHPSQSMDHKSQQQVDESSESDNPGPTIFFIEEGCNSDHGARVEEGEKEEEDDDDDDDDDDDADMSEQELYHKAETFIGNFYRQLRMQREESWNKLHEGFSQH